ncbi:MAG: HDIG domain-containing protein [Candidatus Bathyarchaeia archaeon]
MISREEALNMLRKYVKNENFVKHCIAVEAILRRVARLLGEDEELWGLTGILHDVDYELTQKEPNKHGLVAEKLIGGIVPPEVLKAIKSHNYENTGFKPESKLDKALIASDAASGLLIACALVMPSKKIEEVQIQTVLRKFKSKDFARGVNRNRIMLCEEIGLTLESFLREALEALKGIAPQLGL